MYETVLERIRAYPTITIHSHIQPDYDALGSQHGLKRLIHANFPDKTVYVVGERGDDTFFPSPDEVVDTVFEGALAIIVDVARRERVSDQRFELAAERVVIDHHKNPSDIAGTFLHRPDWIATCQILVDLAMQKELRVDAETATALFAGLVTDSGRFRYRQTEARTFRAAAYLLEHGARMQDFFDYLYGEDLNKIKLKGYFINHFRTTPNNVAYMKNDRHLKEHFQVSTFTISRGMVNQMAGINGIPIWANFTEDDDGSILCELRSKRIPIVDIAKSYGGGGHDLACGCTLDDWTQTDAVLKDLDELVERNN